MPINPPDSTLAAIQIKVRRLTRSPSTALLSDADLNQYINTFVQYDFPEHLRMFNLHETFSFYTNPFQDEYPVDIASFGGASNASANPLYDFQNNYLTINPPIYIAGFNSFYTQSREQFFNIYPLVNSIQSIGVFGDGITTTFAGTIRSSSSSNVVNPTVQNQTATLLQNNVLFSSVDLDGNGTAMIDQPALDAVTGNKTNWGSLVPAAQPLPAPILIASYALTPPTGMNPNNFINYVTGQFVVTFPTPPGAGQTINSQTIPSIVSLPQALLFYDNKFTVRPVPDQPYKINFEVFVRPVALLATNQNPQLNEWWQYIAYGAAKKVLEDRMDLDSVQLIMPEYKKQETLCLRRTIVQNSNERAATIYTEQTTMSGGSSGWGVGSGGPF